MNLKEAVQRARSLSPEKIIRDLFLEIRRIEDFLISLNIDQVESHQNSQGGRLENDDSTYSGYYTEKTEAIYNNSPNWTARKPKVAGDPYNFDMTGAFLTGFQLYIEGGVVSIDSAGTETNADKARFFMGYEDLFGLTDENLEKVITEKVLPFFIDYFIENLT